MIEEGKQAPNFTLKNQDGEEISLSNFKNKKVVIYFYPKDDTPGCTLEGIQFTALKDQFEANNTIILGISKDSVESHKKFCNKHNLGITLLSDEDGKVVEDYGAWREKNNYGKKYMGIVRSTVVLDDAHNVIKHWKSLKTDGHAQKVLDLITG